MNEAPLLFYIDDDQDDLLLFEYASSEMNVVLRLFDNADELFKVLRDAPVKPTVLFVDLNMPTKSGFEIIKEIKADENLKSIPVIVLSTAGDFYTAEKSRESGANYYIQKPTSHQKLVNAIEFSLAINWSEFNPGKNDFIHRH